MFDTIRRLFNFRKRTGFVKPDRNDPCWCGSNKKYKHCHLEADQNESGYAPLSDNEPLSPTHRWLLGKPDYLPTPEKEQKP